MCGRFTLRTPLSLVIEQFDAPLRDDRQLSLFGPRYNIAPTQEVLVVRLDLAGRGRETVAMRWGLVPSWSKDPKSGPPLINARADSLAEKPAFRAAYCQRRCLIPADGFYEWQSAGAGKKQPFYIHRPDHRPFAFAGLWEHWERGPTIESCTIITTDTNKSLANLHDRMPVILAPGDYELWLDATVDDPAALAHLLTPCGEHELVAEPVSTHVNRVANDDPRCIESLAQQDRERMLF